MEKRKFIILQISIIHKNGVVLFINSVVTQNQNPINNFSFIQYFIWFTEHIVKLINPILDDTS